MISDAYNQVMYGVTQKRKLYFVGFDCAIFIDTDKEFMYLNSKGRNPFNKYNSAWYKNGVLNIITYNNRYTFVCEPATTEIFSDFEKNSEQSNKDKIYAIKIEKRLENIKFLLSPHTVELSWRMAYEEFIIKMVNTHELWKVLPVTEHGVLVYETTAIKSYVKDGKECLYFTGDDIPFTNVDVVISFHATLDAVISSFKQRYSEDNRLADILTLIRGI